jgi:hypothetical protein
MVNVPAGRHNEVVCTTDPNLYHPDYAKYRKPSNFYTSRSHGLMCSSGETHTFMMPQYQVENFSGNQSLYYAIGTYGSKQGDNPRFSIAPHALNQVPNIRLADRLHLSNRYRGRAPVYGAPRHSAQHNAPKQLLRWGGDDALFRLRQSMLRAPTQPANGYQGYDDGFDSNLWQNDTLSAAMTEPGYPCEQTTNHDQYHRTEAAADRAYPVVANPASDEDAAAINNNQRSPAPLNPHHTPSCSALMVHEKPMGFAGQGALYAPPGTPGQNHNYAQGTDISRYGAPDYQTKMPEQSLPVGPASAPLSGDTATEQTLDIPEKVRLLRLVGAAIPNAQGYQTAFADEQFGLRWGLIGFRQLSGEIGEVLRLAREREVKLEQEGALEAGHRLSALFGEHWEQLLTQTDPSLTPDPNVRMQPIAQAPLWQDPWISRFRTAAAVAYVQYAQNQVAVERVANPAERVAFWLGLNTPLGLGIIMDRIAESGEGGGVAWLMEVVGPIRTEADRNRALMAVTGTTQLAGFQESQGLPPSGVWDPMSHAALTGALRGMGPNSPIVVLSPEQMLDALLSAAVGRFSELRNRLEQARPIDYVSES